MSNAVRDENFVPTLLGVSSVDGTTPITVYANPSTHRVLVDSATAQSGADITVAASGADYTSIQDALDAVPNEGSTIWIADGTYTITTGLLIKKSNTRIICSGGAVIQCNGANVATLIKTNTAGLSRIEIWGGKWFQTNATVQGTGFDMSDLANCVIHPTRIDSFGIGLLIDDTTNVTFYNHYKDIQIFDCNTCIQIGVTSTSTQPNNNNVTSVRCRPKAGGAGYGIRIADARGWTFTSCNVEPATGTGITGISCEANATSTGVAREIVFYNCWIENNATNVSIASGCNRVSFFGGTITTPVSTNISDSGTSTVFVNVNNNAALLNSLGAVTAASYKVGATAGATGSFTTTDGKTVTVTAGIITAIV